jgi:hypothetical protein
MPLLAYRAGDDGAASAQECIIGLSHLYLMR